jgi:Nucleotidyltransferase of unknown function (DUF6036)
MMVVQSKDLWSLTRGLPWVDACDLAEAIAAQVVRGDLDFRSRLLIRDSLDALKQYWGDNRLFDWLRQCSVADRIEAIWKENLGEAGFPSLRRRIVDRTTPDAIRGCLRELGQSLQRPLQVHLAGSGALILQGYLTRNTDDLDLIDEVPAELRTQQRLLDDLQRRYGLHLGHVQSHYYPSGWQNRVHSEPPYQRLQVFLLDVYDVLLGKLFSKRERDLDDLRAVVSQIDKIVLVRRLQDTAQAFLKDAYMRLAAEHNWYILFGEPLPT